MRHTFATLAAALTAASLGSAALAAGAEAHIEDHAFTFEGPFGVFDQAQLQRGYQVYNEVCSACHGMKYLAYRHLGDEDGPGFPEEQVEAFAAQIEVLKDGTEDEYREGAPYDYFPTPEYYGDGVPPDLSLIAKARAGFHGPYGTGVSQLFRGIGGPEYIYSLMLGYEDAPECAADSDIGGYYNTAFSAGGFPAECIDEEGHHMVPGSWIAMPPQIYEGLVEYADGTESSPEQLSEDISAFLMWAAEPKMMERKEAGLRNILWLGALAVLLYFVNKRLWAPIKRDES